MLKVIIIIYFFFSGGNVKFVGEGVAVLLRWMLVKSRDAVLFLILKWRSLLSKNTAWLSDSYACVAWKPSKSMNNWVRHALWTWKMCVRVYDSSKKATFWDSEGVILTHWFPKGTKVIVEGYEDVLWTKCLPALREKRPKTAAVLFHQDNVPPIRAACVQQFFDDNNFEVGPHAPYTPDLAPSDFWLLPTLKDTFRFRTISSRSALATAIFQWSERNPKEEFAAAMQSWRDRCEICVRLHGDYVEKWLHFQLPVMSSFFYTN